MTKITSFYPFENLRRISNEFYEDKVKVKIKSVKYEEEFTFKYEDVGEISDAFNTNGAQMNFGFWLVCITAFTLGLFCNYIYSHPLLLYLERVLYIGGIMLYVAGFKKSRHIYISDKNDNLLTAIKQTRQNHKLISQIIENIKAKSENVREISTATPFPDEEFEFEHVEFNFSSMKKTTDRFYENRIIGLQKNIFGERVYCIQYNQLNGEIHHGKINNDLSGWVLSFITLFISVIAGFYLGFGSEFGMTISVKYLYGIYILISLFLISLPLNLVKREVTGFHNKAGKVEYWTHVNRDNKDNFKKITEFVLSKISVVEN